MLKILIPTKSRFYASWIESRVPVEYVDSVKDADLILFTGGEDVDPAVYGDSKYRTTYSNPQRDEMEIAIYKEALAKEVPMLGVCRGCQVITALQPRGFLIQDVSNHTRNHDIEIYDTGEIFTVTSTHHQMMYPFNVPGYQLIAFSSPRISREYFTGNGRLQGGGPNYEPEIVFYKKSKALACQMHPEMMSDRDPFVKWLFDEMVNKLNLKI